MKLKKHKNATERINKAKYQLFEGTYSSDRHSVRSGNRWSPSEHQSEGNWWPRGTPELHRAARPGRVHEVPSEGARSRGGRGLPSDPRRCSRLSSPKTISEKNPKLLNSSVQNTRLRRPCRNSASVWEKNPNITQTEMAKMLGITRDGISYNIKQLKNKGIIERVGATKNGKWVIVKNKKWQSSGRVK